MIPEFHWSVIASSNRSKSIGRKKIYPYDGGACTNAPPLATRLIAYIMIKMI